MTTTTCYGCGKTDNRDLYYWTRDGEGNFWHYDCRREDLKRHHADLLSRPIKERHDGPTTRDPGRRSTTG